MQLSSRTGLTFASKCWSAPCPSGFGWATVASIKTPAVNAKTVVMGFMVIGRIIALKHIQTMHVIL
jgi:hypothetical protein